MLFDLLKIIESTGFAKGLSGIDRRSSEWTDSNIKLITVITETAAKMDNQVTNSQDGNVFR